MRVLFVEDEKLLADALKHLFESNGIEADACYDGQTGNTMALVGGYDIIVLDVMLPGMDGLEILKNLREKGHTEPILMLTAKDSLEDKVKGLNLGADDYLVKPFESDELLARVNALSRRAHEMTSVSSRPNIGNIKIFPETSEIIVGDQRISLTGKEMAIFRMLVKNQGHPKSKGEILSEVWGERSGTTENSVELYIHYLRKKLEGSTVKIKTVRGQGYMVSQV